jgi:transposase InsO family protein
MTDNFKRKNGVKETTWSRESNESPAKTSCSCARALNEAMRRTGRIPKILNTDQGSQLTGRDWTSTLEADGIEISMDGKGRWMDNIFIERLYRRLKYAKVRLWSYDTVGAHHTHDYATPCSIYEPRKAKAA